MRKLYYILFLILIGGLTYIPYTGHVHLFDWDEINFAESAREMVITNNYNTVQIDFKPFWEKPPLFIWMQALSMKHFGINEFAARLPNAICGILTLLILFLIGSRVYNETFGIIWSLAYFVSVLPMVYFKSGIIDPWFNLFIFLGIWFIFLWWSRKDKSNGYWQIIFSAFFTGLAILTKGPVGLLITALTAFVYLIYNRVKIPLKWQHVLVYLLVMSATGGFWFILQLLQGNQQVVLDFIHYQIRLLTTKDAGHGGFLLYHFVILLIGVFPASIFALRAFTKNKLDKPEQKEFKHFMMILFWVVLILFTIVKTKIVHYSSMCYFPLTFLAAWVLHYYINGRIRLRWYYHLSIGIVSGFFLFIAFVFPVLDDFKSYIIQSGIIKDDFLIGNLQATAGWTKGDMLPGIILSTGILIYFLIIKIHHRPLALITLALTTWLFTYSLLYSFTTKFESYLQHAAIEFYQTKIGKDCYIKTVGFKSYAHLFYADKRPPVNPESRINEWLLKGKIDKPAFIILKNIDKKYYLTHYPGLYLLYEKNGFVFCSRKPEVSLIR